MDDLLFYDKLEWHLWISTSKIYYISTNIIKNLFEKKWTLKENLINLKKKKWLKDFKKLKLVFKCFYNSVEGNKKKRNNKIKKFLLRKKIVLKQKMQKYVKSVKGKFSLHSKWK